MILEIWKHKGTASSEMETLDASWFQEAMAAVGCQRKRAAGGPQWRRWLTRQASPPAQVLGLGSGPCGLRVRARVNQTVHRRLWETSTVHSSFGVQMTTSGTELTRRLSSSHRLGTQLLRTPKSMAAVAPSSGLGVCEANQWEPKPETENLM